jgi:hypothetical protein
VSNTGVNLSQVVEIVRSCKQQIIVSGDNEKKANKLSMESFAAGLKGGKEQKITNRLMR